jgi:beta-aspartyl-dipeptidase (metallo-type)
MLKLLKNADVYAPEHIGKRDILITADKIGYIKERIDIGSTVEIDIIDVDGKILVPGFIDSHVHIVGGGGEGGYKTRTPEIMLTDITSGGVTTVVGCLGTDETTRTLTSLIAKARGLEEEGISSYILTGSYHIPVRTITGSIQDDIMLIDKIIGVGEIALSDHRSSQPTIEEIKKIAAASRIGGMLSGKAGIVNIHIGDGPGKLSILEEIAAHTEIPITQFIPTHLGRNRELFKSSIQYAKNGGLVDLTTSTGNSFSENGNIKCSKALKELLHAGVPIERVSFTSDGQGSLPLFDEKGEFKGLDVGRVTSLFNEVRDAIIEEKIPLETAIAVITSNPAKNLKLHNKGSIRAGKDADFVILGKDFDIVTVIAKGKTMIKDKEVIVKGTFEA